MSGSGQSNSGTFAEELPGGGVRHELRVQLFVVAVERLDSLPELHWLKTSGAVEATPAEAAGCATTMMAVPSRIIAVIPIASPSRSLAQPGRHEPTRPVRCEPKPERRHPFAGRLAHRARCGRSEKRPPAVAVFQGGGKLRRAHEEFVDRPGGVAAFGDGPDDQALAARHVAGGEDLGDAGPLVGVGLDVAHRVELDAELLEQPFFSGPTKPIASSTRSAG